MKDVRLSITRLCSGTLENRLALGVALTSGLLLAVTLVFQVKSDIQLVKARAHQKQHALALAKLPAADTGNYYRYPLFGKPFTPVQINTAHTLLGILHANGDERSKVIIKDANQGQVLLTEGDRLDDGSIVSKIEANRVVLSRYGASEILMISWDSQHSNVKKYQQPITVTEDVDTDLSEDDDAIMIRRYLDEIKKQSLAGTIKRIEPRQSAKIYEAF